MRFPRLNCLLPLLMAILAVAPPSAPAYEGVIEITWNERISPHAPTLLREVIGSEALRYNAAMEVPQLAEMIADNPALVDEISIDTFQSQQTAAVDSPHGERRTALYKLSVSFYNDNSLTDAEVFEAIAFELEHALVGGAEQARERLVEQLYEAQEQLEEALAQQRALLAERREIAARAGNYQLDPNVIREQLDDLKRTVDELHLERSALEMRLGVLRKQLDESGDQSHRDRLDGPRETMLEAAERRVGQMDRELRRAQELAEQDMTSRREIEELEVGLADARAELAELQVRFAAPDTERVLALSQMLLETEVDLAELEGRSGAVQDRLAELRESNVLEIAETTANELQVRLELAQRRVHSAADRVMQLEAELHRFDLPTVTLPLRHRGLDDADEHEDEDDDEHEDDEHHDDHEGEHVDDDEEDEDV